MGALKYTGVVLCVSPMKRRPARQVSIRPDLDMLGNIKCHEIEKERGGTSGKGVFTSPPLVQNQMAVDLGNGDYGRGLQVLVLAACSISNYVIS